MCRISYLSIIYLTRIFQKIVIFILLLVIIRINAAITPNPAQRDGVPPMLSSCPEVSGSGSGFFKLDFFIPKHGIMLVRKFMN